MPHDPRTSPWWLERLGAELDERDRTSELRERYYDGDHPFPLASVKFREAFQVIFRGFSDNFCRLVVQAVEERMTVDGFRFGGPKADRQAWAIWQDNKMDMQSQRLHREALVKAEGLAIVGWDPLDTGRAVIRVQEPEHVVTGWTEDPLAVECAMKRWESEAEGRRLATLYYPDRLEKYQWSERSREWEPREMPEGDPWVMPHGLGEVPVVAFPNDADIEGEGTSEIEGVIPLQNAVNKLMVDMLTASEFGAYRQRWATGVEVTDDPETGRPHEPWKAAVDRVWTADSAEARFGSFEPTDLAGYIKALEAVIQHIASTSRTPAHYLLGQAGSFPSGEALKSVETGLVAKARRRHRDFGEGWEQVMRLALRVAGNDRAGRNQSAETVWRDPETRTESEHVDALSKLTALGVPLPFIWAQVPGVSPQMIDEWKAAGYDRVRPEPAAQAAPAEEMPMDIPQDAAMAGAS